MIVVVEGVVDEVVILVFGEIVGCYVLVLFEVVLVEQFIDGQCDVVIGLVYDQYVLVFLLYGVFVFQEVFQVDYWEQIVVQVVYVQQLWLCVGYWGYWWYWYDFNYFVEVGYQLVFVDLVVDIMLQIL